MKKRVLAIGLLMLVGCSTANKEIGLNQLAPEPKKPLTVWVYDPQPDLTTRELSKIMVLFFRWQNMRGAVDFEKELNKAETEKDNVSIVKHFRKQEEQK
jgi:hypothetical protein